MPNTTLENLIKESEDLNYEKFHELLSLGKDNLNTQKFPIDKLALLIIRAISNEGEARKILETANEYSKQSKEFFPFEELDQECLKYGQKLVNSTTVEANPNIIQKLTESIRDYVNSSEIDPKEKVFEAKAGPVQEPEIKIRSI